MSSILIIQPILGVAGLLERLAALPVETFAARQTVLASGQTTGRLYVMIEGAVEVTKDGVRIAEAREPGALALLLGQPHTADVRTLQPSRFHVADGRDFLSLDPAAALYVATVLARRLDAVNRYLVEARSRLPAKPRPGLLEELIDNIAKSLRHGAPIV